MIADALALWPVLSLLVGWLVGAVVRAGQVEPPPACNQNCRQGRDCSCGRSPATGETPP